MKTKTSILLNIIFVILLFILAVSIDTANQENAILNLRIEHYQKTFIEKEFINFPNGQKEAVTCYVRSFDAGKNWYAVDKSDGLIILGKAEKIYPDVFPLFMNLDQQRDSVIKTINQ